MDKLFRNSLSIEMSFEVLTTNFNYAQERKNSKIALKFDYI